MRTGRPRTQPLNCTYCGREGTYAKGLCRSCYGRLRYSGSLEPKQRVDENHDRNAKIAQEWASGRTLRDIAKEYGISHQRVQQITKEYFKKTNSYRIRHMTDEELATWMSYDVIGPRGNKSFEETKALWLEWLIAEADE